MKKAVKFDPLREDIQGAYKRMGYGLKLGYEKGSSGIILNLFSAKNDQNSKHASEFDTSSDAEHSHGSYQEGLHYSDILHYFGP